MNRYFTLALSFLITTFSFAQSATVLNLELTNTSTSTDFMMMEVYIETSPAYIVGDEGPNPNNPIPLFIGGTTMETSLTFGENVDAFDLFITQVCSDNMGAVETTIIPPVTLSYNGELDSSGVVTMDFAMELACGEGGEPIWDCPNLNANIGSSCQGGWGVVDENCDCVEYEMNCLEEAGIDVGTLMMYFILECGNENNLEPWYFCGLAESIAAANAGDEEACADVWAWVEANDWDGSWDPGNGGNDFDCPELFGNIGEPCDNGLGVIDENCDCVYNAQNCFEGLDTGLLILYAYMECGNQDNPDAGVYCGLIESIQAAVAGDEEACADVWAWVEANNWDGSWDPGNGGGGMDCEWYVDADESNDLTAPTTFNVIIPSGAFGVWEWYVDGNLVGPNTSEGGLVWADTYETICAVMYSLADCPDPGTYCYENGGNDFDCPELGGNVGDWCTTNNGAFGEITLYCECIEIQGCGDFEVSTNLLANDDGTGNGSVEAIASGGTPPYSYEWEAWSWEVIGTDAVLDNCVAGVYFVQATDFNGCVAFGNEEVLLGVDTLEWDCPNLSMNVGDPCQGGWGIIDEDCECIEDMEIGGCEALFTIDQAIDEEDGEAVLFALFVYLWNYDESNEYYWSFGDEGGSSDPFPVWTYESNGPYEICLTVSNELEECSNTYCSTIGVDSLGWDNGLQDGFTITVINGDEDSQSSIDEQTTSLGFEVFPNPIIGNEIKMNWFGESNDKITFKLIDITGKTVSFKTWFPSSESEQLSMNIDDVNSGMYLLKMNQGRRSVTSRVIINR